ncbi:MAG: FAD-dependent oxidoreductase [Candidatus Tectomicrobia bacterium]|nr:FAD-dependent oxidoreductase [Candidatus Tectomicrobia bacterium]
MGDLRFTSKGLSYEVDISSQRTMVPVYDFPQKTSPCRVGCPAGHDIAWALYLVRQGEFGAALALFREESPFPSITGRVCYYPCEAVCNRGEHDEALAINMLERALADHGTIPAPRPLASHAEHIAVVGSGPAGLTAAYHLAWLGYRVTVYEKEQEIGGVLRYGIPDYRLPRQVVRDVEAMLRGMGVAFRTGAAVGPELPFKTLLAEHDALFLGVGLSEARALTLKGIEAVSSMPGIEFLYRAKEGRVRSIEGHVLVIGAGDVALDVARSAKRLGADKVSIYYRVHLRAHPEELREAARERISIDGGWEPVRLAPQKDGGVVVRMQGVDHLVEGRAVHNERQTEVRCDHIIYAVGQRANASFLPPELLSNGGLAVNALGQTAHPKVFAGGDITGSYNVVEAIGGAKRAVIGIDSLLRGRDGAALLARVSLGESRPGESPPVSLRSYRQLLGGEAAPLVRQSVPYAAINADYFPPQERVGRPHLGLDERRGLCDEVNLEVPREVAIREASRCFHCGECTVCGNCFIYCPDSAVLQGEDGFFSINGMQCKGCGQCVAECPRSAMSMVPEGDAVAVA